MSKLYYPYCKENKCNGELKIKFNNSFTLDYECEKNNEHKGNNIYFKTFERFYLKEKLIEKCHKCNINLLNSNIFICKKCENNYCISCFLLDEHIKESNNNLEIISKKCKEHNMDLYYYCTNCKENLCIYCIKQNEKNNKHNNHCFKKLLDEMPSLERINNLKDKIIKKSNCYKQLIYKLNDWKRKINIKIEELIHNLNDEITLLEKMFLTFEKFFLLNIFFKFLLF